MITSLYQPVSYSLTTGVGEQLTVPWRFLDTEHVKVKLGSGLLAEGVGYSISGEGDPSGGTVTLMTGAAGDSVVIYMDVPLTQLAEYMAGGPFPAATTEAAIDKLTLIAQVLARLLNSSVRAPETEDAPALVLPPAAARAETIQGYDVDGDSQLLSYAQLLALLNLEIPAGMLDRPTTTFASAAGRAATTPDFTGQLGVQLDTGALWRSTGVTPGAWTPAGMLPSIVEYGGVPDDQNVDNALAIRAALTAHGSVYLPPGTWYCSTEVQIADGESDLSVIGPGTSAVLKLADNAASADFRFFRNTTLSFDQCERIYLANFAMDCNGDNQPGTWRILGIGLSGRNIVGQNLEVRGWRGGSAGEAFVMYLSDRESDDEGIGNLWVNCRATAPAGYSDAEVEVTVFHVGALSRPVDVSAADVQLASTAFDGSTDTITSVAHGLNDGDLVYFDQHDGAGTLPSGILEDEPYFVANATADTFQLQAGMGARAQVLDFGTDATGNVWYFTTDGDAVMRSAVNGAILGCVVDHCPFDSTTHRYSYKSFSIGGRGLICAHNRAHKVDGNVVWLNAFYGYHRDLRVCDNVGRDVKVGISLYCNHESARYRNVAIENNTMVLGLNQDVPDGTGRQDLAGIIVNVDKDADGSGFMINAMRGVRVRSNTIAVRDRAYYDSQSSAVGKITGILLRAQTVGAGFGDWVVEDNRIHWGSSPDAAWGANDHPILVQVNEDVFEPATLPDKIQFDNNRFADGSLITPVIQDSTSGTVEYFGPPVSVPQFIDARHMHEEFLAAAGSLPWDSTLAGGMTFATGPGNLDDAFGVARFAGLTTVSAARSGIIKLGGGISIPAGGLPFDIWMSCKVRRTAIDRRISYHTDDVDLGTDTITVVDHGFLDDEIVRVESYGTPIVPLAEGTDYYIVNATADTFQLSLTLGGAAIDLTGLGTAGTFNRFIGERSSFAFGLVDLDDLESTSKKGILLGCMRTLPRGTGGDGLRRLVGMVGNGGSAYEWEILGDENESQNGDWLEGTIVIPGDLAKIQFTLRKTWQSAQYTRNTRVATATNLPTGVTLYPAILCAEQINNATGSARAVEVDSFSLSLVPRRVS